MYSTSTQRKFWTFDEEQLVNYRFHVNLKYARRVMKSEEGNSQDILTPEEELMIVRHYERKLRDFLQKFRPANEPLPKEVKGTTFHFFKRFFIVSSVMDYHPNEIMLTCSFLACKVCEYVLAIDKFVMPIGGDKQLVKNFILDQESEVLSRINFILNIHTPYRAVEGIMIDLRTRSNLHSPERLYEHISRFLYGMWLTDVCLLYSPALIALAAVMHATSRCKENIDNFVMNTLLNCPPPATMNSIIQTVREIRSKVMNARELPSEEEIARVESRLAIYRNPKNNPNSEAFRRKMEVKNDIQNNNRNKINN